MSTLSSRKLTENQLQTPQKSRNSVILGSSGSPILIEEDATRNQKKTFQSPCTPRKRRGPFVGFTHTIKINNDEKIPGHQKKEDMVKPQTPQKTQLSILGMSPESPIEIEDDDSKSKSWSSVSPDRKGQSNSGTAPSASAKRRGWNAKDEQETPTKRSRHIARSVQATLIVDTPGRDSDEETSDDSELLVYEGGLLIRFGDHCRKDIPESDGNVQESREISRTMSVEAPEISLRASSIQVFEKTFRSVAFLGAVSVKDVMAAVNAWVNKPAGESTFTLEEVRAALRVLDSRKVISFSGETVYFPDDSPPPWKSSKPSC
ncbi:Nn.00g024570.m01.CDS01 [Neocucurbitaria sp. VM-36]